MTKTLNVNSKPKNVVEVHILLLWFDDNLSWQISKKMFGITYSYVFFFCLFKSPVEITFSYNFIS